MKIRFPGMVEGHVMLEQGGQQAAQHRQRLAEGHVLLDRREGQKGKEKPESMCRTNSIKIICSLTRFSEVSI
jgi:hypothetical protein